MGHACFMPHAWCRYMTTDLNFVVNDFLMGSLPRLNLNDLALLQGAAAYAASAETAATAAVGPAGVAAFAAFLQVGASCR